MYKQTNDKQVMGRIGNLHRDRTVLGKSNIDLQNVLLIVGTNAKSFITNYALKFPETFFHAISLDQNDSIEQETLPHNVKFRTVRSIAQARHCAAQIQGIQGIVDNSLEHDARRITLMRELFYFLDDGGSYAIENLQAGTVQNSNDTSEGGISNFLFSLINSKIASGSKIMLLNANDRHMSNAISKIEHYGKSCIAYKEGEHFYKVRDHDANIVLDSRYGEYWGQVIENKPGGKFASSATTWTNKNNLSHRFPEEIKFPEISHRIYKNAFVFPGQVVTLGTLVLPDTFRHLLGKTLHNKNLTSVSDHFVLPPDTSMAKKNYLRGEYFYLDTEYPGVYGHVTTEIISRLWAWNKAKTINPNLKVLVFPRAGEPDIPSYERLILSGYGISDDDIYVLTEPSTVESLIAATPMFSNPKFANPQIKSVWKTIRDNLRSNTQETPQKVFLTRPRGLARDCRNAAELEDMFESFGFAILRPETLPLGEQIDLFINAKVIAGYGGSALLNAVFSDKPKNVIIISPDTYNTANEYLISSTFGDYVHYFWCDADIQHKPEKWTWEAFQSPFVFNFDRDGENLRSLLKGF